MVDNIKRIDEKGKDMRNSIKNIFDRKERRKTTLLGRDRSLITQIIRGMKTCVRKKRSVIFDFNPNMIKYNWRSLYYEGKHY